LYPNINYPFSTEDSIQNFVRLAKLKGLDVKLYYTIRELSVHSREFWAFRSLGDEIFSKPILNSLPDTCSPGYSWLGEHVRTNYVSTWHQPLKGGDWDIAIQTKGLSRLSNFYLEGLNHLMRKTGINGIYIDGSAYDHEVMKRVRKVIDAASNKGIIDFHSGNNFDPAYGLNSPANQYMEIFPYINSLCLGEGYDYEASPDYWLTEISGIPFGLYSEMLQNCGNPYLGMLYGMTGRLGCNKCDPSDIWKVWDDFGIEKSSISGYWDPNNPIKSGNDSVLITSYKRKDRILIAIASWAKLDKEIKLMIDGKKIPFNA
jgi:hypothetical protein